MALLEYSITSEIQIPEDNANLVVELLEAAHAYEIPSLDLEMRNLLSSKSADWYGVDSALRLFWFTREKDCCKDLKIKIVEVLKT